MAANNNNTDSSSLCPCKHHPKFSPVTITQNYGKFLIYIGDKIIHANPSQNSTFYELRSDDDDDETSLHLFGTCVLTWVTKEKPELECVLRRIMVKFVATFFQTNVDKKIVVTHHDCQFFESDKSTSSSVDVASVKVENTCPQNEKNDKHNEEFIEFHIGLGTLIHRLSVHDFYDAKFFKQDKSQGKVVRSFVEVEVSESVWKQLMCQYFIEIAAFATAEGNQKLIIWFENVDEAWKATRLIRTVNKKTKTPESYGDDIVRFKLDQISCEYIPSPPQNYLSLPVDVLKNAEPIYSKNGNTYVCAIMHRHIIHHLFIYSGWSYIKELSNPQYVVQMKYKNEDAVFAFDKINKCYSNDQPSSKKKTYKKFSNN